MKSKLLLFLALLAVFFIVFSLRFFLGGNEDTWICKNNQWVKHGNPKTEKPQTGCEAIIISPSPIQAAQDAICSYNSNKMTITEAKQIAINSECSKQGMLQEIYFCNGYTGTWWIDLTPTKKKEGCNPACVIDIKTKKAEINWRCTGLLQ